MRKHFSFICALGCSSAFSFYRFQGPYVIDEVPNENSINNCYSLNKENLDKKDIPFLYEPNCSLSIALIGPLENGIKDYNHNILRGNFDYNDDFWKVNEKNSRESYMGDYNFFISFMYKLPMDNDDTFSKANIKSFKKSFELHKNAKWSNGVLNYLSEEEKKKQYPEMFDNPLYDPNSINYFYLDKTRSILSETKQKILKDLYCISKANYPSLSIHQVCIDGKTMSHHKAYKEYSDVYIKNCIDGVTLSKGNKVIDLQEALIKYYESNINTKFAQALQSEDLCSLSARLVARIPTLNHPHLDEDSLKLLRECKILALWCAIPEEREFTNKKGELVKKRVHFKLFGLAEDKDKKKFHWITDLNNNISVLLRYARND